MNHCSTSSRKASTVFQLRAVAIVLSFRSISTFVIFGKHLHGNRQFKPVANDFMNAMRNVCSIEISGNRKVPALKVGSDFTKPSIVECLPQRIHPKDILSGNIDAA